MSASSYTGELTRQACKTSETELFLSQSPSY